MSVRDITTIIITDTAVTVTDGRSRNPAQKAATQASVLRV